MDVAAGFHAAAGLRVDSGMEFGTGMVMFSSGCGVIYLLEFIKIHNRTDLQVWRLLQTYTLQRASKMFQAKRGTPASASLYIQR